jgi:subtilisin
MVSMNRARRLATLLVLIGTGVLGAQRLPAQSRGPATRSIPAEALLQARTFGKTRVIVGVDAPFTFEPALPTAIAVLNQRASISRLQSAVLARMLRVNRSSVRRFSHIPFLALEVDERDLQTLAASPEVKDIEIDAIRHATLAESTPLVGATRAWAAGYSGAGWTVAVIDTGVDKTHPFLAGKVVSEACYSTTDDFAPTPNDPPVRRSNSVCPGGVESSTSPGSGAPCAMSDCVHGTHVAGIVAGKGTSFSGVARDGSLIAIQAFSSFITSTDCGSSAPCALSFTSDQILGLEHVYDLRTTYNIAAVNMSLGSSDVSTSPCDDDPTKAVIDLLRAAGIATVIASGNGGSVNGLSAPACISTAISVASTTDGTSGAAPDQVSNFSNTNQYLSLFAPGETIRSSVPGGGFANFNGTSMAAPHVAGAWAVMKSRLPSADVTQIMDALAATGTPIVDPGNLITKPRINVDLALQLLPVPCGYTVSPSRFAVGPQAGTATVTVTTTAANCPWTALSLSSFVVISAGQNGIGPGTVVANYAANPSKADREGTLNVAGSTVTIAQRGRPTQPDVNSDGLADIMWQHLTGGWLATWYLDGWTVTSTYFLGINRVTDTNWRVVGSGDLNGDGHTDLVWQHRTEGWLAVWYLSGTDVVSTLFLSINRVPDLNWEIRGVGDVDGDGKADLIWQHRTGGWVAAWLMDGQQVVATRYLSIPQVADTDWQVAGAGDTNGDGYADLVWQHRTRGWLAVWSMRGTDVIGTELLSANRTDLNWHIRGVGDVDADHSADIIWQNDATGELGVWMLNGSLVVNQRTLSIDRVADLNWRIVGPG